MKDTLGAFLLVCYGFLIGLILAPATAGQWSPEFLTSFAPQFWATIAGVFAGAWISAEVEKRRDEKQERRERATAANVALFTLARMYTGYLQLLRDVVQPVRDNPMRWYAMRPIAGVLEDDLHFDFESLQFLIASRDPNVLSRIDMWKSRYKILIETLKRRSSLHAEQLQPLTENAGLKGSTDSRLIEQAAGIRIKTTLASYADSIVQFVDEGVREMPALIRDTFAAAAPMIGNEKLVRFDIEGAKRSLSETATRQGVNDATDQ
jgi:hypothetical protein